jgi:hypothetical protein
MVLLYFNKYSKFIQMPKNVISILGILSFFSILCTPAVAQTCTGSLGAPIRTIDFGTGIGRSALSGLGVTTYIYNGNKNDGIHDNQYCLSNNSGEHPPDWWFAPDHTPNDVNGRMLVVNADPGRRIMSKYQFRI